MTLRTDLDVAIASAKLSIAWRFSMMLSIITGPLFIGANYVIWKGIYAAAGTDTIRGYTFEEMLLYIIISGTALYLTWDDMDNQLREDVRKGNLITYLLRPLSYIRYSFAYKIGHRTIALLIEFLPVMLLMGFFFGWALVLRPTIPLFFAAIAIAFVISFLLRTIIGMLAFYIVRPRGVQELYKVVSGLLSGTFLSLSLYPQALQKVFFFLPFQFVTYVPAQVFIGEYQLSGIALSPYELLLYGVMHTIILLIITMLLWRHAVKRFCGVGT